jgi:nucleotide-binding universal stress UspA family protein
VVFGRGADTIVDYAADNGIDLIVMGTHGRTGMAHLLLGSVAERVVRTAHCAVLTVRTPQGHHPAHVPAAVPSAVPS